MEYFFANFARYSGDPSYNPYVWYFSAVSSLLINNRKAKVER